MENLNSRASPAMRMKTYTRKDYYDSVSELISLATKKHGNEIMAIYAGGSFAREDFVPGRSDIDVYVVAKDDSEELRRFLERKAAETERKYFNNLRSILDEVLSIAITTLEEVQSGRSFLGAGFEYSNFMDTGRLLWGTDIKPLIRTPLPEKQKESAKEYLNKVYDMVSKKEKSFIWFRYVPFRILPRSSRERWTREAFNLTFRTIALFLGSKGVYVSRKEDIANAFRKMCADEKDLCTIISFASSMWEKWKTNPLSAEETKRLLKNSLILVKGLKLLENVAQG
jgi:predicted nucleotidyltransferase